MLRHLISLIALFIASGQVQEDQYLYLKSEGLKAFTVGNYADAERYFSEVLKISRATRPGSRDLALDVNSLAEVYRLRRRTTEAQRLFEEALSILKKIPGSERQAATVLE